MSAVVVFVIDAIVAVVAFLCKQDRNSATMGMGMECANVQIMNLLFLDSSSAFESYTKFWSQLYTPVYT
jgi:hypothetical protein